MDFPKDRKIARPFRGLLVCSKRRMRLERSDRAEDLFVLIQLATDWECEH